MRPKTVGVVVGVVAVAVAGSLDSWTFHLRCNPYLAAMQTVRHSGRFPWSPHLTHVVSQNEQPPEGKRI